MFFFYKYISTNASYATTMLRRGNGFRAVRLPGRQKIFYGKCFRKAKKKGFPGEKTKTLGGGNHRYEALAQYFVTP